MDCAYATPLAMAFASISSRSAAPSVVGYIANSFKLAPAEHAPVPASSWRSTRPVVGSVVYAQVPSDASVDPAVPLLLLSKTPAVMLALPSDLNTPPAAYAPALVVPWVVNT